MLWFCTILLLAFSFPLQVLTMSPYPSLLPYFLILVILLLNFSSNNYQISNLLNNCENKKTTKIVSLYILLLLLNTGWQTAFGVISLYEGATALVIYLLPVFFYWYFLKVATEKEIIWVLLAISVSGFIVGVFFAYDSYLKLAVETISLYAQEASDYSVLRGLEKGFDVITSRARPEHRSFGPLESRAVSASWIILGFIASLALLPLKFKFLRRGVIVVFGLLLFLTLNFTAVVTFLVLILLFEFGGASLLVGNYKEWFRQFIWFVLIGELVLYAVYFLAGDSMSEFLLTNIRYQINMLLGIGNYNSPLTFLGLIKENFYIYYQNVHHYPYTLLLGDGFSSFGIPKSGDIGFIESMAKFGVPFFFIVVLGLFYLILRALKQVVYISEFGSNSCKELMRLRFLQFSISVILMIFIAEGHYSVWKAKSILPIVFIVVALLSRYISVQHRFQKP